MMTESYAERINPRSSHQSGNLLTIRTVKTESLTIRRTRTSPTIQRMKKLTTKRPKASTKSEISTTNEIITMDRTKIRIETRHTRVTPTDTVRRTKISQRTTIVIKETTPISTRKLKSAL